MGGVANGFERLLSLVVSVLGVLGAVCGAPVGVLLSSVGLLAVVVVVGKVDVEFELGESSP